MKKNGNFFSNRDVPPSNVTEIWLSGKDFQDAMRACGVDEKYVSGNASDFEKFKELCRVMPSLLGNKIYAAAHRELFEIFGCSLHINSENCEDIWTLTAELLLIGEIPMKPMQSGKSPPRNAANLKTEFDDAKHSPPPVLVLDINDPSHLINSLTCQDDIGISSLRDLYAMLSALLEKANTEAYAYYHLCRDFRFIRPNEYSADIILKKILSNKDTSAEEKLLLSAQIMRYLGREYVSRGIRLFIEIPESEKELLPLLDYLSSNGALSDTAIVSEWRPEHIKEIFIPAVTLHRKIRMAISSGVNYREAIKNVSEYASVGNLLGLSPIASQEERSAFDDAATIALTDIYRTAPNILKSNGKYTPS